MTSKAGCPPPPVPGSCRTMAGAPRRRGRPLATTRRPSRSSMGMAAPSGRRNEGGRAGAGHVEGQAVVGGGQGLGGAHLCWRRRRWRRCGRRRRSRRPHGLRASECRLSATTVAGDAVLTEFLTVSRPWLRGRVSRDPDVKIESGVEGRMTGARAVPSRRWPASRHCRGHDFQPPFAPEGQPAQER